MPIYGLLQYNPPRLVHITTLAGFSYRAQIGITQCRVPLAVYRLLLPRPCGLFVAHRHLLIARAKRP